LFAYTVHLVTGEGDNPIDGSAMFGDEHSHDWWCYFYRKGSLAAQLGDWDKAQLEKFERDLAKIYGDDPQPEGGAE
jgi:hypothetical protein